MKAVMHVKVHGRITNRDYCDLTETIYRTASRDLQDLVSKGVLRKIGVTGRNVHYVISRKQDIKRTNRTCTRQTGQRDTALRTPPECNGNPKSIEQKNKIRTLGTFRVTQGKGSQSPHKRIKRLMESMGGMP